MTRIPLSNDIHTRLVVALLVLCSAALIPLWTRFALGQDDKGAGGSGTVLDMHTQQRTKGNKGVRFEDPHWWAHLPALKPIGLTCLLAERNSEVRRRKELAWMILYCVSSTLALV